MRQLNGMAASTLQKFQIEAARLVTGLTRSVSLENLYKEYGWATLLQEGSNITCFSFPTLIMAWCLLTNKSVFLL